MPACRPGGYTQWQWISDGALFGATGMILGPAALAVTVAVLNVWHSRMETAEKLVAEEPREVARSEEMNLPAGFNAAWAGP